MPRYVTFVNPAVSTDTLILHAIKHDSIKNLINRKKLDIKSILNTLRMNSTGNSGASGSDIPENIFGTSPGASSLRSRTDSESSDK